MSSIVIIVDTLYYHKGLTMDLIIEDTTENTFAECSIVIKSCYSKEDVDEFLFNLLNSFTSIKDIYYFYDNKKYLYIHLNNTLQTIGLYYILYSIDGYDTGYRDFIPFNDFALYKHTK